MSFHAITARRARWLLAVCMLQVEGACITPPKFPDGTVVHDWTVKIPIWSVSGLTAEDLRTAVSDQLNGALQQEDRSVQADLPPVPRSRLATASRDNGVLRPGAGGAHAAKIGALRAMETELNAIDEVVRSGRDGRLSSRSAASLQAMLYRLRAATSDYVRAVDAQPERHAGEHADNLRWLEPIHAMQDQMAASFAAADRIR